MVAHQLEKLKEMRRNLISQTKKQVSEKLSGEDIHLIRAVTATKNLEQIFNLVSEQTFEWYGLHFPELRRNVNDPVIALELIATIGLRKNFSQNHISTVISDSFLSKKILELAKNSVGGEVEEASLKSAQELAKEALSIHQTYENLQRFIRKQINEIAPNFSELATPMIGAQLLARAGSLERLAAMPGSTLQVLGAEEALFSHLKKKTKPPKHGFIFNHPLIKSLPKKARGRMARALAGKLAICVRADLYGDKRIVEEYKTKLDLLNRKLKKLNSGR
jgi:nucleolar protein 56